MASSVEWTKQFKRCTPMAAVCLLRLDQSELTMFAMQILEDKPHVPIMTNHPKPGGIASFATAIGAPLSLADRRLAGVGFWRVARVSKGSMRPEPQAASPGQHRCVGVGEPVLAAPGAGPPPCVERHRSKRTDGFDFSRDRAVRAYVGDRIARYSGYPASFCHGHVALVEGLGLTAQQVQSVAATIASEAQIDPEFDGAAAVTAGDLNRWVRAPPPSWSPMATVSAPSSFKTVPVQTVGGPNRFSSRVDPYVNRYFWGYLVDRVFSKMHLRN